jgi:hypothetical protein
MDGRVREVRGHHVLTAVLVDDETTARRRDVARLTRDDGRGTSAHDLLDHVADLAHAAEAAARRMAVGH